MNVNDAGINIYTRDINVARPSLLYYCGQLVSTRGARHSSLLCWRRRRRHQRRARCSSVKPQRRVFWDLLIRGEKTGRTANIQTRERTSNQSKYGVNWIFFAAAVCVDDRDRGVAMMCTTNRVWCIWWWHICIYSILNLNYLQSCTCERHKSHGGISFARISHAHHRFVCRPYLWASRFYAQCCLVIRLNVVNRPKLFYRLEPKISFWKAAANKYIKYIKNIIRDFKMSLMGFVYFSMIQ